MTEILVVFPQILHNGARTNYLSPVAASTMTPPPMDTSCRYVPATCTFLVPEVLLYIYYSYVMIEDERNQTIIYTAYQEESFKRIIE